MPGGKWILFFLFLFTTGLAARANEISFKASAPQSVVMGEQFRLTYVINAEGKDLRVQEMPDFEVLMGPSQSTSYSTSWVNGKSTSETTVSYTYILMPKKEGTFTIAPATIKVKDATYTSNGLSIKVLPPDKSGKTTAERVQSASTTISDDDFFVRMIVSKHDVYEQEGFLVTFKLYAARPCGINGVKFPEFEGFMAQEIDLPNKQWVQDRYKDRNYFTVDLRQVVLYPQRTGDLTIGKGTYDAVIRVSTPQKARSIFDDFFDSYREVNKQLVSSPATIHVKPLPSGKPASFSGAVGSYSMTARISANQVKANDAVTVNVQITGNGNIKMAKNPEVTFPNDFEIYDPKVDTQTKTTTAGVSGTKTIEYMAIPRYAGDFEIPSVEFSYFDTKSASYKTLKSDAFQLHVEKGEEGAASAPVVSNFANKESVKYLGQDIRFLKTRGIHFSPKREEVFFGTALYAMSYLVPLLLFIVFFIVYRKQIKENADLARVRTKKANKIAVKRLKNAGKLLQAQQKEAFYDEVMRALWGYLSDKLNMPLSSLTKDNVEAELAKYGVDEALTRDFMEILNTCEFARYAPSQASDAMDKLYEQTIDAIGKMENTIKK
ncbi:BatD family protein [Parabacteroides sp. An277]|uniref:BatD family protein n=1 Tax=Parabacteroides sp. An277 TaxID=1965619 RepID=UPI000B38DCA9|nr:BatD family protein [Parabacteroides sp. An277]